MISKLAAKEFEKIRDIPYRIPLTFSERDDCCSGKHSLLFKKLSDLGYKCRYRICTFRWSDLDLPKELLDIPHEELSTHVYLEVEVDGVWKTVDATWDKSLAKILPVNDWDGDSDTNIAVSPIEIYPITKSVKIMATGGEEEDLKISSKFYEAFNKYLEFVRTNY